jgi:hypothetical protein
MENLMEMKEILVQMGEAGFRSADFALHNT